MAKIFRDLKVKLTVAEWSACAAQLAQEQERLEELDLEKKAAVAALKSRLETVKGVISGLGEKVRSHEEVRAVECWEKQDERRFVVELYRDDTGELVETRPMTAAERHEAINPPLPHVEPAPEEKLGARSERLDGFGDDEVPSRRKKSGR